eukprot:g18558.t1
MGKRAKSLTGDCIKKKRNTFTELLKQQDEFKVACNDLELAHSIQADESVFLAQRELIVKLTKQFYDSAWEEDKYMNDKGCNVLGWIETEAKWEEGEERQECPWQMIDLRKLDAYQDAMTYIHKNPTLVTPKPIQKKEPAMPSGGKNPALEQSDEAQKEASRKYLQNADSKSPFWCRLGKALNPLNTDGRGKQEPNAILKLRHLMQLDQKKYKCTKLEENEEKPFYFLKMKHSPKVWSFESEGLEPIHCVHAHKYYAPLKYLRHYWAFTSNTAKGADSMDDTDMIRWKKFTVPFCNGKMSFLAPIRVESDGVLEKLQANLKEKMVSAGDDDNSGSGSSSSSTGDGKSGGGKVLVGDEAF